MACPRSEATCHKKVTPPSTAFSLPFGSPGPQGPHDGAIRPHSPESPLTLSKGPWPESSNRECSHPFILLAGKPFSILLFYFCQAIGVLQRTIFSFFMHLIVHNYLPSVILVECVLFNLTLLKNGVWKG